MKKLLIAGIAAATLAGFASNEAAEAANPNVQVSMSGPYVYTVKAGTGNNCYSLGNMLRDMKMTYQRLHEGKMDLQSLLEELVNGAWTKYVTVTPEQPEQKEEVPTEKPAPEQPEQNEEVPTEKPAPEQPEQKEEVPAEKPAPEQPEQKEEVPTEKPAPEQEEVTTPGQEVETPAPEEEVTENDDKQEVEASGELTQEEQQMVDLVNQARQQQGLAPLKVDIELTKVARAKSQDMISRNYFDHNSPTYGSPFEMMKSFGIQYRSAAENIAGNQTVERAHNALMNSAGHYKNIMGDFTEIGIGIVDGGPYGKMFTQMFTK